MAKVYVLKLSEAERGELELASSRGRVAARKVQPARAFLLCDQGEHGPAWRDEDVAEAVGVSVRSIENWRKRACEEGPLEALTRRPRIVNTPPRLDGEGEAQLVRIACSTPPEGRARWTLRLLADQLVTLEVTESISYETVRRTLKKTASNHG